MNTLLLLGLTLGGHTGIWVALYNQMNATNAPLLLKKVLSKGIILGWLGLVGLFLAVHLPDEWFANGPLEWLNASALGGYAMVCWMFAGFVTARWTWWQLVLRPPVSYRPQETTGVDLTASSPASLADDPITRFFASLPGNQIFQLSVTHKQFELPELPAGLDGLKIVQLSDLHMTGRVTREFYEALVQEANRCEPDVIVITGDIIDKRRCLSWLEPVLSQLQAKHGVFYVLGNHDLRVRDEKGLRKRLKQAGLIAVNGRWQPVSIGGNTLWIGGNELPWFRGAEKLEGIPAKFNPKRDMRVLLSHSPDQVHWARKRGIPFVLAGHTHGGQIRVPLIGPLVAPSRFGVKYASGEFQVGPVTMHVSRGLSGVHPVRFLCPPELAVLTLRATDSKPAAAGKAVSDQKVAGGREPFSETDDSLEQLPEQLEQLTAGTRPPTTDASAQETDLQQRDAKATSDLQSSASKR